MTDALALVGSLVTLALAFGVLVLPHLAKANRSLLGAGAGLSLLLVMADSSFVAWALLASTVFLFITGAASPRIAQPTPSGWHNWFVVVVTASSLWLLSLFLLWTLEEALSHPVDLLSVPPTVWEIVSSLFDRQLWVVALLTLLAGAIGWGAVGIEAEEP